MPTAEQNQRRLLASPFRELRHAWTAKAERKERDGAEVDALLRWITGYEQDDLDAAERAGTTLADWVADAPAPNPAASLITGSVCGVRVEQVAEPTMRTIRQIDKIVDELAKGHPLERIMRTPA